MLNHGKISKFTMELEFIDIHYHSNPDLYIRRHSAIDAGKEYKKLNGLVMLHSHLSSTAEIAVLGQELGLPLLGAVVLNSINGGIDKKFVLANLAKYQLASQYRLLVSFPTIITTKHVSKLSRSLMHEYLKDIAFIPENLSLNGELRTESLEILELSKTYPVAISTGHASKEEVYLIAEASKKHGLKNVLITQPANPATGFNAEELIELAENYPDLYIEQTALTYLLGYQSWEDFTLVMQEVPNLIYSSDLGQTSQMDIEEWLTTSHEWFDKMKLSSERIKDITKNNPLKLLQI